MFENYPVDRALIGKNQQIRVGETRIVESPATIRYFAKRRRATSACASIFNYQCKHFDEAQIARLQRAFVPADRSAKHRCRVGRSA